MELALLSLLEALLLVTALSIDSFVASFAYGADHIKIPLPSVAVISAVCTATLVLSLLVGRAVSPYLPPMMTKGICFSILFCLGLVKLFDSSIKSLIRKKNGIQKQLRFSLFHLSFILSVYADPEAADHDCSRTLSPVEAASLAAALSLDGLAVGFGTGLASFHLGMVASLSLVCGALAVLLGSLAGNHFAKRSNLDLSWLCGALLIVLAVLKL